MKQKPYQYAKVQRSLFVAKSIRDGVQCQSCKQVVTGYEHRVKFSFIENERVFNGDYAVLSCGCEIMDYELLCDRTEERVPVQLIDNLRKTVVLEFNERGPINKILDDELDED